uniref:C2H2-type domain-containing protein n=1 Tax=Equus asinus TaxID=9793 RepID=A0A9L0I698_EQUAS
MICDLRSPSSVYCCNRREVVPVRPLWLCWRDAARSHQTPPAAHRSNCAENIRKHILHTGKHEGVKMYNCPKCDYGTNVPVEFRNHLKEQHPDIENPDLAYLHAVNTWKGRESD